MRREVWVVVRRAREKSWGNVDERGGEGNVDLFPPEEDGEKGWGVGGRAREIDWRRIARGVVGRWKRRLLRRIFDVFLGIVGDDRG